MFGYRSDGRKLKNVPPFFKIIPSVMITRNDSQVYFKQDIVLNAMDDYIAKKLEEGIRLSYMDIIYATVVRIIAERPSLNRFAMNGRLYARDGIYLSLAIKKSLSDNGQETTLKIRYDGTENIFEIKDKLEETIKQNKDTETSNNTDNMAGALSKIPTGFVRFAVKVFSFLDKHGLLPRAIINASPFHTSAFLTNVGSLGIDTIYHHLYNFGTTSMFFAMGKKKKSFIYEDDEIKKEKCITIAFVGDERICDGYYYASSFRSFIRYLNHPELLEEHGEPKKDVI